MSSFHQQDIDGCEYTMSVLRGRLNIINWKHTEGDYDRYDMDMSAITISTGELHHICDENKDRRYGWKYDDDGNASIDYDKPQYISTYSSQMFNFEKYETMMDNYEQTGDWQGYTAGYLDGVILFDVATLPKDKIYTELKDGGWKVYKWIREKTMDGRTEKVLQPRFLIPNEYGTIYYKQ